MCSLGAPLVVVQMLFVKKQSEVDFTQRRVRLLDDRLQQLLWDVQLGIVKVLNVSFSSEAGL